MKLEHNDTLVCCTNNNVMKFQVSNTQTGLAFDSSTIPYQSDLWSITTMMHLASKIIVAHCSSIHYHCRQELVYRIVLQPGPLLEDSASEPCDS